MDSLPSSAFRKTYARLRAPTTVTVQGHAIGTWYPAGTEPRGTATRPGGYLTPPFTDSGFGFGHSSPVPKPGKKAK